MKAVPELQSTERCFLVVCKYYFAELIGRGVLGLLGPPWFFEGLLCLDCGLQPNELIKDRLLPFALTPGHEIHFPNFSHLFEIKLVRMKELAKVQPLIFVQCVGLVNKS